MKSVIARYGTILVLFVVGSVLGHCREEGVGPITPEQAVASKIDLWGEAALRRPDGPTYEYFRSVLPPPRYVDAFFHHYPLCLSAPAATIKGRVLSNGSQVNALAHQPNWFNERGVPLHVLVGKWRRSFGEDRGQLDGPHYVDGYLPICRFAYGIDGESYGQEIFAAVEDTLSSNGVLLAAYEFPDADAGYLELQFEAGHDFLSGEGGVVRETSGTILAAFDANWEWNKFRNCLTSKPHHSRRAVVQIFTLPADANTTFPRLTESVYNQHRQQCIDTWTRILRSGMQVDVPEPYVNHAWRSLLIGMYGIISGDQLNYSAANQYARMYASETHDALRALLVWGHQDEACRMMPAILRKQRPNMEYHYAAFDLHSLISYRQLTHDDAFVSATRPLWQAHVDRIMNGRERDSGMLPRQQYCTDIETMVYNLVHNSLSWRALRDVSVLLQELGDPEESRRIADVASAYRKIVLTAIDKATTAAVDPPFLPVALGGEEPIHDPITATRIGSYWNLIIGYVLSSGVFPYDSQTATNILRYQQTKGGLCMGMIRCQSAPGWWINTQNIDDLYGIRYALMVQQRDEADRALVSFYGKLAQGLTHETFVGAEGISIIPYDEHGRQMYLPPNSASNASFLLQLRGLLVQDWDLDDDAQPETLRLLFATPRAWLEDGKSIRAERAPTAFGEVSLQVTSHVNSGVLKAEVEMPPRVPKKTLIKFRLPKRYHAMNAVAGDRTFEFSNETVDLTGLSGHVSLTITAKEDH